MRTEIKRWGNSAAVRLPSKLIAAAHLDINNPILIEAKNGEIIIKAAPKDEQAKIVPLSEKTLLAGLTASTAHADELATIDLSEFGQ